MRLQNYLKEAVVKTTNADIYLTEYAPIFMWNPTDGFLWSIYDKKTKKWNCYKGSKLEDSITGYSKGYITHVELAEACWIDVGDLELDDTEKFISGRISPDGKIIYIHGLKNPERHFTKKWKTNFNRYINKTVKYVYDYMKDYIK